MIIANCKTCDLQFSTVASRIKEGKGKFCSRDCYYKDMTIRKGEATSRWKGDEVGYASLHEWVRNVKGTPSLCAHCGSTTSKKYEWANVSREYKRDLDDWLRLCTSCHHRYDYGETRNWNNRNPRTVS